MFSWFVLGNPVSPKINKLVLGAGDVFRNSEIIKMKVLVFSTHKIGILWLFQIEVEYFPEFCNLLFKNIFHTNSFKHTKHRLNDLCLCFCYFVCQLLAGLGPRCWDVAYLALTGYWFGLLGLPWGLPFACFRFSVVFSVSLSFFVLCWNVWWHLLNRAL